MIYPNEWTGGVAFTQYNIIAIGIGPNDLILGRRGYDPRIDPHGHSPGNF